MLARYADIEAVALVALGKYRAKLPAERRSEYVRNAGYYMSRFLADVKAEVHIGYGEVLSRPALVHYGNGPTRCG